MHFIDSLQSIIEPEIQNHIDRWGDDLSVGGDIISWQGWVDKMSNFFVDRPAFMRTFMNDKFSLEDTYELTLNYNETTGGTVVVNTNEMETPYNFKNLYFKNIPLQVKAIAKPNYVFSHWLETGDTNPVIDFVSSENAVLTPIFIDLVNTQDLEGLNHFELYPNPTSGLINIALTFDQTTDAAISMYNLLGQQVYQSVQRGNNIAHQLDLSSWAEGMYLVSVETRSGKAIKKVLLTRKP